MVSSFRNESNMSHTFRSPAQIGLSVNYVSSIAGQEFNYLFPQFIFYDL